jgi:hypothetical protein
MPDSPVASVVVDGVTRHLGCLAPRPDFGGLPKFGAANALIPRTSWGEVDLSPLAGDVWDQGQHGSCVGHGSTKAYEIAFRLAGGTVPPSGFSPTSLYALVNGGRDGGAVVSDAMDALIDTGVCTMAECPESVIFKRNIPASADATRSRFRVADAFHCDSFDAIGSALQLGYPVSFGITLALNFQKVDSEGVAGHGWGVLGGHCMCAYGTKKLQGGAWAIRVRNSWGKSWGLNGDCLLIEQHFGRDCDAFAIRADSFDPQDPAPAPVART